MPPVMVRPGGPPDGARPPENFTHPHRHIATKRPLEGNLQRL